MAQILFHFGAHKTGTTHLQYNFYLNRKYLEEQGIKYFTFLDNKEVRKHATRLRKNIINNDVIVEESTKYISHYINRELKGYDYAIISYEGCLGELNHQNYNTVYPEAELLIKHYKNKILNNHKIIVLFSIRDYADFILSTYKFEIKDGLRKNINQYCKELNIDSYRWTEIILAFYKNFHQANFLTYEDYKMNQEFYLKKILNLLPVKINMDKIVFNDSRLNISSSDKVIKYQYLINKIIIGDSKVSGYLKRRIYHLLNKLLANKDKNKAFKNNFVKKEYIKVNYYQEVRDLKNNYNFL